MGDFSSSSSEFVRMESHCHNALAVKTFNTLFQDRFGTAQGHLRVRCHFASFWHLNTPVSQGTDTVDMNTDAKSMARQSMCFRVFCEHTVIYLSVLLCTWITSRFCSRNNAAGNILIDASRTHVQTFYHFVSSRSDSKVSTASSGKLTQSCVCRI